MLLNSKTEEAYCQYCGPGRGDIVTHNSTGRPYEKREKDPDTGGEKGVKLERYEFIPVEPLRNVARVYGYGARKYSDRNWEKGYPWSWSYGALQRHINSFWGGEEIDSESGLPHLAHAAFHLLALMEFGRTHPEKDDRSIDKKTNVEYPVTLLGKCGCLGCRNATELEALRAKYGTGFPWFSGEHQLAHKGGEPSRGPVLRNDLLGGSGDLGADARRRGFGQLF